MFLLLETSEHLWNLSSKAHVSQFSCEIFFYQKRKNGAAAKPQRGKCLQQEPGHHLWIEVVWQ